MAIAVTIALAHAKEYTLPTNSARLWFPRCYIETSGCLISGITSTNLSTTSATLHESAPVVRLAETQLVMKVIFETKKTTIMLSSTC